MSHAVHQQALGLYDDMSPVAVGGSPPCLCGNINSPCTNFSSDNATSVAQYQCADSRTAHVHEEHEDGNWFVGFEGGVHSMAQVLEHDFIIGRRMAERVATYVAHREGISVCPKYQVAATRAKINVVGTVKFKRVGEAFCGDHAPLMQG
eukprot:1146102-Pelagomonas_calceolata.AAC.1